jgi:hypothetical protein
MNLSFYVKNIFGYKFIILHFASNIDTNSSPFSIKEIWSIIFIKAWLCEKIRKVLFEYLNSHYKCNQDRLGYTEIISKITVDKYNKGVLLACGDVHYRTPGTLQLHIFLLHADETSVIWNFADCFCNGSEQSKLNFFKGSIVTPAFLVAFH